MNKSRIFLGNRVLVSSCFVIDCSCSELMEHYLLSRLTQKDWERTQFSHFSRTHKYSMIFWWREVDTLILGSDWVDGPHCTVGNCSKYSVQALQLSLQTIQETSSPLCGEHYVARLSRCPMIVSSYSLVTIDFKKAINLTRVDILIQALFS